MTATLVLGQLATERLPDTSSRTRLEAGNPTRNGAARNFEQINAFDSRCDHPHPSCKSALELSNGKCRLATMNVIYNVREKYTRWGAVFQTINGCAAHSSRRLLTCHLKPCSLVTLFTMWYSHTGQIENKEEVRGYEILKSY